MSRRYCLTTTGNSLKSTGALAILVPHPVTPLPIRLLRFTITQTGVTKEFSNNRVSIKVIRCTGGVGASATARPLEVGTAAFTGSEIVRAFSVEPTETGTILQVDMDILVGLDYIWPPGEQPVISPATRMAIIIDKAATSGVPLADLSVYFEDFG